MFDWTVAGHEASTVLVNANPVGLAGYADYWTPFTPHQCVLSTPHALLPSVERDFDILEMLAMSHYFDNQQLVTMFVSIAKKFVQVGKLRMATSTLR